MPQVPRHQQLGVPTEYGFALPRLRHELSLPYLPGGGADALLDLGCGNGANTVLYAGDARSVVGIDVVPELVVEAQRYAEEHGLDNLRYVLYDGGDLPFEDDSFDHVVSYEVLEHVTDDARALAELRRVMRPGAVLTMSVPNKWYLMETHGFTLKPAWVPWNRVPLMSWLPTPLHERWANARIYSRRRIERLLASQGFEVLEHRYVQPPFDRVAPGRTREVLQATFHRIERSPLEVIGVAHFIAARPR